MKKVWVMTILSKVLQTDFPTGITVGVYGTEAKAKKAYDDFVKHNRAVVGVITTCHINECEVQ